MEHNVLIIIAIETEKETISKHFGGVDCSGPLKEVDKKLQPNSGCLLLFSTVGFY